MGRLDIRNLPDEVLLAITKKAKAVKISREKYVREQLIGLIQNQNTKEELKAMEKEFYEQILPVLEKQNELLNVLVKKI